MLLLTTTDFDGGRHDIPLNPLQTAELQADINAIQDRYLPRLFGKKLGDLFIVDLAAIPVGDPTDPRFVFIDNPFVFQDDSVFLESRGIKDMLKGFVYFIHLRRRLSRATTVGLKKVKSENSDDATGIEFPLAERYNEAVDDYQAMQRFMRDVDPDLYPEYMGIRTRRVIPL